jgi:hypothetical protein
LLNRLRFSRQHRARSRLPNGAPVRVTIGSWRRSRQISDSGRGKSTPISSQRSPPTIVVVASHQGCRSDLFHTSAKIAASARGRSFDSTLKQAGSKKIRSPQGNACRWQNCYLFAPRRHRQSRLRQRWNNTPPVLRTGGKPLRILSTIKNHADYNFNEMMSWRQFISSSRSLVCDAGVTALTCIKKSGRRASTRQPGCSASRVAGDIRITVA